MADADERASHGEQVSPPAVAHAAAAMSISSYEAHADDDEEKVAVSITQTPPATTTEQDANASDPQPAATNAPLVTVNLKFIHRERLSVQCARDILVSELKKRVLELYARHVESDNSGEAGAAVDSNMATGASLRLIYKGKVFKDDQTLAMYSFVNGDTIHAVFGRPQTTAASANDITNTAAASATTGSTATSSTTTAARNSTGGVTFTTNGVNDLSQFSLNGGENLGFAEIGSFLNTILSSFAGPEGTTARTRVVTSDSPSSMAPTSTVATSTATAASPTPPATATTSSAATAASTTAFSTTGTSGSTPTPATSTGSASNAPVPPTPVTAIRYSLPLGPPRVPPSTPSATGNAASLLNQAASLRRIIPALELSPLSQPPELSDEMYALGNAMREAGDTFLAVHRQLQFIATRFLSENNLNESERLRLRTRVHQLVSILDQVGALSRAVSGNLATSSFGPLAHAQPPAQASQNVSQPPATATHQINPLASQQQPPASTPATTPTTIPTTSVSVTPTVNIFSGGYANAPGTSAPTVGNSIAEILQAVSGLTGGATNQQSSAPGSLGNLLNLVSALTSNGARPGQSTAASFRSSTQETTVPVNPSQPTSESSESVQSPPADSSSQVITASIPSQPLSALFTQVMRDMDTLDEWDPDTAEDLLKRLFPHLRHRVRSLVGSASNATARLHANRLEQSVRKKWCENAAEEIESAMCQGLETYAQPYTRDHLRCRINEVSLGHLLAILLDSNTDDLHDQDYINTSLEKLRKLLRKFCTSVHVDISEQTSSVEAVRITSNIVSSILTTEDLSVRRSAEALASRVNREVTSLLKNRTA